MDAFNPYKGPVTVQRRAPIGHRRTVRAIWEVSAAGAGLVVIMTCGLVMTHPILGTLAVCVVCMALAWLRKVAKATVNLYKETYNPRAARAARKEAEDHEDE